VKNICDCYSVLDVLVHPLFYDTVGNVVAKILSMGVVSVLTSRRVGAKDLTQLM
jgi:glycosyltransferase involved in cell wall biosynthesis